MSKILKRILSSFLVMAMIIATVPVKVMASSEEQKSSTTLLLNGGQEVVYDISETTEKRMVTFEEDGVHHVAEFNKITNEIFFDGEKVGDFQPGITTYTLHEFNRYEGNLGNLVGSVSSVAAVILSIAGFPSASKAAELANVILGEGYKKVWYRVIEYYDDEFTGSRPNIIRKFYFYSDANYSHLIWST